MLLVPPLEFVPQDSESDTRELKGSLTPADFRAMLAIWMFLVPDQSNGSIRKQALY
jgi:hypothetical protein